MLTKANRKIDLFVDNFSGHTVPELNNIRIHFFPANTTSVLQPLDQGIIRSVKSYYRKQIIFDLINKFENVSIELFNQFLIYNFNLSRVFRLKK